MLSEITDLHAYSVAVARCWQEQVASSEAQQQLPPAHLPSHQHHGPHAAHSWAWAGRLLATLCCPTASSSTVIHDMTHRSGQCSCQCAGPCGGSRLALACEALNGLAKAACSEAVRKSTTWAASTLVVHTGSFMPANVCRLSSGAGWLIRGTRRACQVLQMLCSSPFGSHLPHCQKDLPGLFALLLHWRDAGTMHLHRNSGCPCSQAQDEMGTAASDAVLLLRCSCMHPPDRSVPASRCDGRRAARCG